MAKILSQEEVDALLKSHTKPAGKACGRRGEESGVRPRLQAKKAQAQRKVTLYNFRRPDRVSREQMRSLHFMHDRFARNFSSSLSAYLRTITEVNLVSVEQLSYQEFLLSVPDPTCFNAISIKPLEGALALEVNPTLVFPIIDKMLGGPGEPLKQLRTMTDIEQSIFDGVLKLVLEDLREAWRGIVDLDFRIQARETSPQLIQIVAPNEVVLLVVFEVKIGPVSGNDQPGHPEHHPRTHLHQVRPGDVHGLQKVLHLRGGPPAPGQPETLRHGSRRRNPRHESQHGGGASAEGWGPDPADQALRRGIGPLRGWHSALRGPGGPESQWETRVPSDRQPVGGVNDGCPRH